MYLLPCGLHFVLKARAGWLAERQPLKAIGAHLVVIDQCGRARGEFYDVPAR